MKNLIVLLLLGILITASFLLTTTQIVKAGETKIEQANDSKGLCGFAYDGVCCEDGTKCYCIK